MKSTKQKPTKQKPTKQKPTKQKPQTKSGKRGNSARKSNSKNFDKLKKRQQKKKHKKVKKNNEISYDEFILMEFDDYKKAEPKSPTQESKTKSKNKSKNKLKGGAVGDEDGQQQQSKSLAAGTTSPPKNPPDEDEDKDEEEDEDETDDESEDNEDKTSKSINSNKSSKITQPTQDEKRSAEREVKKAKLAENQKTAKDKETEKMFDKAMKEFKGDEGEQTILKQFLNYQVEKSSSDNEGLYLFGIDLPSVYDFIQDSVDDVGGDIEFEGKYKSEEERQKALEERAKKTQLKKEREEEDKGKSSFEVTGEHIDVDYETVLEDIMGIRREISDSLLEPHKVLSDTSTFPEIIQESKKYKRHDKNKINPKSLLNMVRILDERKTNENQWLRVASLCEIIYLYFNQNKKREQFFESIRTIDDKLIMELEEFWKTDWIFRGPLETEQFKKTLEFYRNPDKKEAEKTP